MNNLNIEQRFILSRARYEVVRMSRPALEKVALRLLRSRMEMKNGVQNMLQGNGILFKIEENQGSGLPEIISEETFCDLLALNSEDEMSTDIEDIGWEDEDLDQDDLMLE